MVLLTHSARSCPPCGFRALYFGTGRSFVERRIATYYDVPRRTMSSRSFSLPLSCTVAGGRAARTRRCGYGVSSWTGCSQRLVGTNQRRGPCLNGQRAAHGPGVPRRRGLFLGPCPEQAPASGTHTPVRHRFGRRLHVQHPVWLVPTPDMGTTKRSACSTRTRRTAASRGFAFAASSAISRRRLAQAGSTHSAEAAGFCMCRARAVWCPSKQRRVPDTRTAVVYTRGRTVPLRLRSTARPCRNRSWHRPVRTDVTDGMSLLRSFAAL